MIIENRINAFIQLGKFLKNFNHADCKNSKKLKLKINQIHMYNGWFDIENVQQSINSIVDMLNKEDLVNWLSDYKIINSKSVAVIMAGNIPLVGFYDLLCVLISGHKIMIKMSSNDNQLLPIIIDQLKLIEPEFSDKIFFYQEKLESFDAVIATGSNNSARYFDYYFNKYPSVIRKNRVSLAILDGQENKSDLDALSRDVFQYFGLGCRNVSKLFLPRGYNLDLLFNSFYQYKNVIHNEKYANNYHYNKVIYMMGKNKIIENGFLIMIEHESMRSPISVLNYEYYDDFDLLNKFLKSNSDEIQCIVSNDHIPFGYSQNPTVYDCPDGIDVMSFLETI